MGSCHSHSETLENSSFSNLKKFTFDGLTTKAKIVDVYDGDTVTIVFFYNGNPVKYAFRIIGYDAPEIKPKRMTPNRELHCEAAICVRNFLKERILGKVVWIKFSHEEKYGRLMGDIYLMRSDNEKYFSDANNVCISRLMINLGFGKEYNGGHKCDFTCDELRHIIETSANTYTE